MQEDWVDTGAPQHLTASYAPNVRPARAWRHIPAAAYWGESDFQGIEPIMDSLEEVWSSWMRDIINGRGRVVVPNSMLDSLGPWQGTAWSDERRLHSGLNMPHRRSGSPSSAASSLSWCSAATRRAQTLDDHEKRLDTLGRRRWPLPTIAALAGVVGAGSGLFSLLPR